MQNNQEEVTIISMDPMTREFLDACKAELKAKGVENVIPPDSDESDAVRALFILCKTIRDQFAKAGKPIGDTRLDFTTVALALCVVPPLGLAID